MIKLLFIYGLGLIIFSIWFWIKLGLKSGFLKFVPPVTSLSIIAGVVIMWLLIFTKEIRQNIFGIGDVARSLLLQTIGTVFTGFILMITILWSLEARKGPKGVHLNKNVVYIQCLLFVLLFFFIIGSFYYILSNLG